MKQTPTIWTVPDLRKWIDGGTSVKIRGQWHLARPLNVTTLWQRIKTGLLVFTGKADALTWPGDQ